MAVPDAAVLEAIRPRLGADVRAARHLVAHNRGASIRPLRGYVRRDGNHVISHGEKCAAVHGGQRRHDFGHSWRQELKEFVLPHDAFETGLCVADDVGAAPHDKGPARRERLDRRA
jgi:hypothetical protein